MDAHPPGAAKLAGIDLWRLRVGDLRAIYLVDDEENVVVVVLRVARRSESTYRRP